VTLYNTKDFILSNVLYKMSISQLLQPNSYDLYGNFKASKSGTLDDELTVVYATTTVPPTYTINKISYSVFDNIVMFQASIILLSRGAGSGEVAIVLPDSIPQAIVDGSLQICQLIVEVESPEDYSSFWGELNADRTINLWKFQQGFNPDILDFTEIKVTGLYFT
jgi:hypothetical protein